MASTQTRYREIQVEGNCLQMGQQIGEEAREEVRGFAHIALERVNKTISVSRENALEACRNSFPFVQQYSPHLLDELRGIEASSGVSIEKLMLLQMRNQLLPDADAGCTSFSIAPQASSSGGALVGQNWDNDPALDPFTIVLTRRPSSAPDTMTLTQAGLIAYIGLNDRGIGVCMNTLPAPSRRVGVPHYFVLRAIYEGTSLDEAAQAVRGAHRAIPANLILSTPQGPADFEITVENLHILPDQAGRIVHTNHCLHPDLARINDEFPELIQSHPRKLRLERLFGEAERPLAIERIKTALKDHEDFPRSICRHVNDHPTNGFWTSVFSVIVEADAGRMQISRGNPCEAPYENYRLN